MFALLLMAPKKGRIVWHPEGYHPYGRELRLNRKSQGRESNVVFSNIEFEVISDAVEEFPPTWLIKETGDTYEFMVERRGLKEEEVEVQVEKQEESTSDKGRALLTIYCERNKLEGTQSIENLQYIEDGLRWLYDQCQWRFGRRFKLPADAYPERARAAHEHGIVTVVIPRECPWRPLLKVPKSAPCSYRCNPNLSTENCLPARSSMHPLRGGPRVNSRHISYAREVGEQDENIDGGDDEEQFGTALRIKWVNVHKPDLSVSRHCSLSVEEDDPMDSS